MSDRGLPAMGLIFNEVCVLVTAAFALTLMPGFRQPERSLLSRRDRGATLLVFTILGLVEEAAVSHAGLLNERIVAVCAAGLVAGPWVGLLVGVFVTWLAVALQPLVENAIQHGLHSSPHAGRLQLAVRLAGSWLEMSVRDDGTGVPPTKVEQLFFAKRRRVHALTLLRRRLQGLFGRSFQLEVRSEVGEGTTVTMRIPLRKRFEVGLESPEAVSPDLHNWAHLEDLLATEHTRCKR